MYQKKPRRGTLNNFLWKLPTTGLRYCTAASCFIVLLVLSEIVQVKWKIFYLLCSWLVFNAHSTHYRSFWGRFFTDQMIKPTVSNHWRKPVGRRDQTWISSEPLYHVTIMELYVTASMHGVRVPMTNPICWTCKNCSYKCEHCVTVQHRALLIIFPLNLKTNTITQLLSSGGGLLVEFISIFNSTKNDKKSTKKHKSYGRKQTGTRLLNRV